MFPMKLKREEKIYLRHLGLNIRNLRKMKDWTLEDTEEMGWTSWRHLQEIESGKRSPGIITLRRISKLYNISLCKIVDF